MSFPILRQHFIHLIHHPFPLINPTALIIIDIRNRVHLQIILSLKIELRIVQDNLLQHKRTQFLLDKLLPNQILHLRIIQILIVILIEVRIALAIKFLLLIYILYLFTFVKAVFLSHEFSSFESVVFFYL